MGTTTFVNGSLGIDEGGDCAGWLGDEDILCDY